jgi:hypothetical protein
MLNFCFSKDTWEVQKCPGTFADGYWRLAAGAHSRTDAILESAVSCSKCNVDKISFPVINFGH